MSDQDVNAGAAGQPAAPAPDSRIADLEAQVARERARADQAAQVLGELEPYRDTIQEIVTDEELRDLYQTAKQGREQFRATQKKPLPAEFEPLLEEFREVSSFVKDLKSREATTKKASEDQRRTADKAWQDSAASFVHRISKDVPGYLTGKKFANGDDEMTDDGLMMVQAVATLAKKHNISFEEAYKRSGDRFVPREGSRTPPASLPVDAGNVGIPTKNVETQDNTIDFASELQRRLGSQAS